VAGRHRRPLQGLVRIRGGAPNLKKAFLAWVVTFALVGGEVAWALRPFVGSIYHPIALSAPTPSTATSMNSSSPTSSRTC